MAIQVNQESLFPAIVTSIEYLLACVALLLDFVCIGSVIAVLALKQFSIYSQFQFIVFFLVVPLLFLTLPKKSERVWINCELSEISPDFTTEMREACRQLRASNNLIKPK